MAGKTVACCRKKRGNDGGNQTCRQVSSFDATSQGHASSVSLQSIDITDQFSCDLLVKAMTSSPDSTEKIRRLL